MQLLSLHIKNFKCFKDLHIDFGQETNIYGKNATGKSSVFDAFTWLLFGKDAESRENFEIKPVDSHGKTDPDAVTEVSATITDKSLPYAEMEIKRTFAENWVKPRGETERVFKGNECHRYINGVEVGVTEFEETLAEISAPDISIGVGSKAKSISVLQLLSNPRHFNENLHWTERKSILFALAPPLSDECIISSNAELEGLAEVLNGDNIEAFIAKQRPKLKKLDTELGQIPARIDEALRNKPDLERAAYDEAIRRRDSAANEIRQCDDEISSLAPAYEDFIQRQREALKAKSELDKFVQEQRLKHEDARTREASAIDKDISELTAFEAELKSKVTLLNSKTNALPLLEEKLNQKRAEVIVLKSEAFPEPNSDADDFFCPTCKRMLEPEDIHSKTDEMRKNFNVTLAKKIEMCTNEGLEIKNEISRATEILENLKKHINATESAIRDKEALIERRQHELKTLVSPDIESLPKYAELKKKVDALTAKLVEPDNSSKDQLVARKSKLNSEIESCNHTITLFEEGLRIDKRVDELRSSMKDMNQQKANIEKQLYKCERFTKIKVSALESNLSELFDCTKIKLIDIDEKGRENECCTAILDGVDYEAVNTAGKAAINLDIINAIAKAFDVNCPVFFDNREGVNELGKTNMQIVNLFVTESDNKLRVGGYDE